MNRKSKLSKSEEEVQQGVDDYTDSDEYMHDSNCCLDRLEWLGCQ